MEKQAHAGELACGSNLTLTAIFPKFIRLPDGWLVARGRSLVPPPRALHDKQ